MSVEALIALGVESREKVDELLDAAVAAGATLPREAQDLGFMYQRAYEDLDGHLWEVFFMDMSAVPA